MGSGRNNSAYMIAYHKELLWGFKCEEMSDNKNNDDNNRTNIYGGLIL